MNIVIYTTSTCPYCVAAKQWLTANNYDFNEVSLNDPQLRAEFKEKNPTLKTVPQIFADDKHIGGYQDLVKSHLRK